MFGGFFGRRILLVILGAVLAFFANRSNLWAEEDGPTQVIEGTVVDEADQPVAGAKVSGTSGLAENTATSDEKGNFRLQVKPGPTGAIYAQLEARSSDGRLGFLAVSQQQPEPVRLVVKPAREVAVVVTDANGKPVEMAEVEFHSAMRRLFKGVTDGQGRWQVLVPADSERWAVLARKGGAGFDYATAERSRGSVEKLHPLPAEVSLKLDGARTMKVKAVDQNGEPVAGVRIGAWYIRKANYEADINLSGTSDQWAMTGADGTVVLDWLPQQIHQSYNIMYRAENHFAQDHAFFVPADKPVEELTINLLPLADLKGQVTHADGRPAEKIVVQAQGQGAGMNRFQRGAITDADGRYKLRVYTEQAYVITAGDGTWAAPYRADVVARAGGQLADVDFVLGPATKVRGRVTVGKDNRPAEKAYVYLHINKGNIPEELRKQSDQFSRTISMQLGRSTDADGRFEFAVGPGEYRLSGPARGQPITLTIPPAEPPQEIVQDFNLPRQQTGPFTVQVVGTDGKPAAGAMLNGRYASQFASRLIQESKVDERGTLRFERALEPMVLHARTADNQFAGVARIDEEAKEGQVALTPTTSATGRLLDMAGPPVAEKELTYGIRVYMGEPERSPFSDSFGGKVTTDAEGRFTLSGLVAGEAYHVSMRIDERSSRTVTQVLAKNEPLALGDVRVDPNPIKPYVPPTAKERTVEAFTAKAAIPPQERLDSILAEARREYTRPLVLLGKKDDRACVELFQSFYDRPDEESNNDAAANKLPTPAELRWEFELLSLDAELPGARELALKLGVDVSQGQPVLAVLNGDGSLAGSHALGLDAAQKLDPHAVSRFLVEYKLPQRNAEQILAAAIQKASAEEKRVFLIFSASWCGPCRMLARFLDPYKTELGEHYVFVKTDISRDEGIDAMRERYPEGKSAGVPWFAILDSDGKAIVNSNAPMVDPRYGTANMGFPTLPHEIDHFMKMLETTGSLPAEKLAELRAALSNKK